MSDEPITTAELLEQWREATRAADLAERLAELARSSVERSDRDALEATEIAKMAERAAKHAERAARVARGAATRAAAFAAENRSGRLADAEEAVSATRGAEKVARDRYHRGETAARQRQEQDDPGR